MPMNTEWDIAIVGMAGRFPGARNVNEFWRNLAAGVESIARLSDEEILASGVPASLLSDPRYVKAAPILEEPGHFDAGFFGFSPMEARTMDPQHRILLELAHEALEEAGYDPDCYAGRVGVFTGAALNSYFVNVGLHRRLTEDYIPTLIGNDKDFLATRISYKLNLRGPSITVQTACSTSMVAVHLACQSLLSEESDMALAGAISVRAPNSVGYLCDGGGVVSADGHVRAFDARANGTVFGSGGGILVLKRLADALADCDAIRAVIKGSAVNNDGSAKAGYTAPSVDSQADAVVEALANAGVEADDISYIEAHGSGTPVGDPIEVRALTKAFRTFTPRTGYCALGSVKTNVGHLDAAAAVTGIIKTVLALEHRQLPPSLHFTKANPEIDFASTPFYVNTALREWTSGGPRRAGVMSTGMGGTNAHLILEEAPQREASTAPHPPHLLLWSAKTETALDQATHRLGEFLSANDSVNMSDVAHTLRVGRKALSHRRCLVCADRQDAMAALQESGSKRIVSGQAAEVRRPVILLLPGLGDHYVGMAYDLHEAWPVFRQEVDRCATILEPHLGLDIRSVLYPTSRSWVKNSGSSGIDLKMMLGRSTDPGESQDASNLNQTLFAQPAQFTVEYAMTRVWQSLGVTPDAIVGHSMGEYVAACLAGVLSLEDALRLIAARAKLVQALPQGAMLAVTLAEDELLPLLPDGLSISLINGPRLCVVAGPADVVARFAKTLDERGIIARRVQNAHAFHSTMLEPIAQALKEEVRQVQLHEPKVPFISNVTGTWITPAEATDPAYWAAHATRTARFNDALRDLWRFENPILLEAGPGRTLGVLAMQHPDRQAGGDPAPVSSIRHAYENRSDVDVLWHAIGKLWLSGAEIRWDGVPVAGPRRRVPLPTYPFERQLHWIQPERVPDAAPAAPGSVHKNPDPTTWLYVPSWKRLLPRTVGLHEDVSGADTAPPWIVFADDSAFTSALIARLRGAGHSVITVRAGSGFRHDDASSFTVDPANPQHYDALIRALEATETPPERIVHAWSTTASSVTPPRGDRFADGQARGFYSLIFLTRAIAAHHARREIRLFVLSRAVHEVSGTEALCPEQATLLGPCMVIGQEYPNIRVQSIDLDGPESSGAHESAAERVLGELLNPDASLFVAHRRGQRWVGTHERAALDGTGRGRSTFRAGGVYLITGGLGEIGIAVSEYLAEHYGARLVLVGRARLPARESWDAWLHGHPPDEPDSARILAIQRIEQLGGDVEYVQADVADEGAMRGVVERASQRFGTLHGVIHAAGIVGDYREISDTDPDSCDAHFRAKARGVRVLASVIEGRPLDFCLLMSSLTSVLGGIGQAAYASSNTYLDAFARTQNRSSTVPWLSVNWDVWRLHDEPAAAGLGGTLRELGMSAEEATAMLETVLTLRTAGQLVVSTGDLGARIDQWIKLESLNLQGTAPVPPSAQRPSLEAPFDAPRDETEQRIAQIWQDALGIEAVGSNDNFADLGGHSLLAVKIVTELRRAFQVDLPVRALFDAPTVAELSRYIKEHLIAEIEALTDEEAQRLVSST